MELLKDILVLDFSQFLSGPSASLRLADMGARVIKIERPDTGDICRQLYVSDVMVEGESTIFHAINRAKESLAIDLKNEDDMRALKTLLSKADVMIQNFRPGVIDRLGLDYEAVRELNPRIVYASISGYGEEGPWVKRPGQDLLGLNAWKTYAYFFGAPAINEDTQQRIRPLDDTSPALRAAARSDRWFVLGFHLLAPLMALGLGGWRGLGLYAVLWLLPLVTVLQPNLRLRAIFEHGAVDDLGSPLTAARCNRGWGSPLNWLARALLFSHHVNHHLEHHLYPAVPHYHLPRLHALLREKGALDGAELRDVRDTWSKVFADRKEAHGAHA